MRASREAGLKEAVEKKKDKQVLNDEMREMRSWGNVQREVTAKDTLHLFGKKHQGDFEMKRSDTSQPTTFCSLW